MCERLFGVWGSNGCGYWGLWLLRFNDACSTLRLNKSEFLRGSVLERGLFPTCIGDLECLLIKFTDDTKLGECKWYAQKQGCCPEGPEAGGMGWQEPYEILTNMKSWTWGALVPCSSSSWGLTGWAAHIWSRMGEPIWASRQSLE